MPEVNLAVALSPNGEQSSDAEFRNVSPREIDSVDNMDVGWDNGKTPIQRHSAMLYSGSSIPMGATVNSAKLSVRAGATNSTVATASVEVLALSDRFNQVSEQTHPILFQGGPTGPGGSPVLWSLASISGTNDNVNVWMGTSGGGATLAHGLETVGQAWTANQTGSFGRFIWYIARETPTGTGVIVCKLYRATGSPGAWKRGALLATSTTSRAFGSIASSITAYSFDFTSVTVTSGVTYICELVFNRDSFGSGRFLVYWNTNGNGSADNVLMTGTLLGFDGRTQFYSGAQLYAQAALGTPDLITWPSFTLDNVYSLGSAAHSPSVVAVNFASNLQLALNARASLSDGIAIMLRSTAASSSNARRQLRNRASGVITLGALAGVVLTINYTAGGVAPVGTLKTAHRLTGALHWQPRHAATLKRADRLEGTLQGGARLAGQLKRMKRIRTILKKRGQS